ncbi:MAG: SRPBCC family protein [Bacteroidetes bacterium]|nr:SRPBCC family protein [Bacteroidota bacterium]
MIIEKEITINKSVEDAWEVLGYQFADAYKWASPLKHSEAKDRNNFNGSACSERGCDIVGMGKTREKLIEYSNECNRLSYSVPEGMPFMVKYATNTWQLTQIDNDKSKLKMVMNITLRGIMGMMMQPMMKMMMSKMGNILLQDFKYYVETGRPSEAKLRALKKL